MNIHVDTSSFTKFARELRRADPMVHAKLQRKLIDIGEMVATTARSTSAWSSRIPGTIKVSRTGVNIRVIAGGRGAPGAKALEHGGQPGTFRHPVFGNHDVWVEQKARPFMRPAVRGNVARARELANRAISETFREVGFH